MAKVNAYYFAWSTVQKKGSLYVYIDGGEVPEELNIGGPEELAALADLMRNNAEVAYSKPAKTLKTKPKKPGP